MSSKWVASFLATSLTLAASAGSSLDPTKAIDLFVPSGDVSNYRIPALVRTKKGTLVAIAEARSELADCCYKYLVFTRSTDNGTSWSEVAELYGKNLPHTMGAGNPAVVYDNVTDTIHVAGAVNDPQHCSPLLWTFMLDDGGSDGTAWSAPRNLSATLGKWQGVSPGPGGGTQLGPASPHPGRLVIPGHYGAYQDVITWYSDDHGASWTLSQTVLPHLDETAIAALPSGRVMLNSRTDHYNASCDCRAVTVSEDGGVTWDLPVRWDATLIEPVCQGSLATLGPLQDAGGGSALFFSNPASKTQRTDTTVRRSDDEGASWRNNTWLVAPGPVWGGYSAIASGAPITLPSDGRQYGAIVFERDHNINGSDVNVISFALFPAGMPPQPTPQTTFIPAADSAFLWTGRRSVNPAAGSVSFDMPGVTASVTVSGASYFTLSFTYTCPGDVRLESAVDGVPLSTDGQGAFWLKSAPMTITVASGLDPSAPHTLNLRLATEARNGGCGAAGKQPNSTITFAGVQTDGVAVPPPAAAGSVRRIEFVGDSITAGALDAPNPTCGATPATQDPSLAASLGHICPALNASCAILAISGDTVLTPNPPIVYQSEKPPIPVVYNRSHTYVPATGAADDTWDFASWVPDAVVLNLGTNDVAAGNFAAAYVPALTAFIAQISGPTGVYASRGLPIPLVLAYCGPMTDAYCGPMQSAVSNATAVYQATAQFLGFVNATIDGCDGHPGRTGQAQMGAALAPMIKAALGW